MEFSMDKLQSALNKRKRRSKPKSKGYGKVILHLWNLESADNIDFDSFTLEDVEQAINEFLHLPIDDNWDEELICDPKNDFVTAYNQRELIYSFIENKHKKYIPLQEDIFL